MRKRFWPRLLKSVLPVALLSGVGGWALAHAAGVYVSDGRHTGADLRDALAWRLPFTLAAWGGGITLACELFRHWWGRPQQPAAKAAPAASEPSRLPTDDEQLLLQFIEKAEAAEDDRNPQPVFAGCPPPPDEHFLKQRA